MSLHHAAPRPPLLLSLLFFSPISPFSSSFSSLLLSFPSPLLFFFSSSSLLLFFSSLLLFFSSSLLLFFSSSLLLFFASSLLLFSSSSLLLFFSLITRHTTLAAHHACTMWPRRCITPRHAPFSSLLSLLFFSSSPLPFLSSFLLLSHHAPHHARRASRLHLYSYHALASRARRSHPAPTIAAVAHHARVLIPTSRRTTKLKHHAAAVGTNVTSYADRAFA